MPPKYYVLTTIVITQLIIRVVQPKFHGFRLYCRGFLQGILHDVIPDKCRYSNVQLCFYHCFILT